MLLERLAGDLTEAMKAKDSVRVAVLRMTKSAIKYAEIEKQGPLSDDEVIQVLSREIKKRRESIVEFGKVNRQDLVEKEEAEWV